MFNQQCLKAIKETISLSVSWYLMASYLYYHEDESLLSDELFDGLCKVMDARWGEITHVHKHLVERGDLSAGTGFTLALEDYPSIVKSAAERLIRSTR